MTERKYKYVKSLIFTPGEDIAISQPSEHRVWTFDFKGILAMPFYIVGVNYEPTVYDKQTGVIKKTFNFKMDPLIQCTMDISTQSSGDVIGDNVQLSMGAAMFRRNGMRFSAGIMYDFFNFPIVMNKSVLYFIFDTSVDESYTVLEMLYWNASFKLFIGTN